jgi:hypothetical protein
LELRDRRLSIEEAKHDGLIIACLGGKEIAWKYLNEYRNICGNEISMNFNYVPKTIAESTNDALTVFLSFGYSSYGHLGDKDSFNRNIKEGYILGMRNGERPRKSSNLDELLELVDRFGSNSDLLKIELCKRFK